MRVLQQERGNGAQVGDGFGSHLAGERPEEKGVGNLV
jgi:hypothetical protein